MSQQHLKRRVILCLALGLTGAALSGCMIAALIGGMAQSYQQTSKVEHAAKYTGLTDKSIAVFVSADRIIQAEFPELLGKLTVEMTNELIIPERTGLSGFVPAATILQFQYQHPDWPAWSYSQLSEHFGVDRIILVDIFDFRLYEVGNVHLWDGSASARVGVIESDGPFAEDFAFSTDLRVRFPDSSGYGPSDIPANVIKGELARRLKDRVTWLFYDHMEDFDPAY